MTYFLDEDQGQFQPRGSDIAPSSWFEGLSAGVTSFMRDRNVNFERQTSVKDESYSTAAPIANRLGIAAIYDRHKDSIVSMEFLPKRPETVDELFMALGPDAPQIVMEMARERAALNPAEWKDLDLTDEGIVARSEARIAAAAKADEEILSMMPNGRAGAEFLGGLIGTMADIRQAPLLLLGAGGGSILKVLGREALLGMAGEAITLPSQFEMAKVTGKAPPNTVRNMIEAAAGGAIIGGGIHARFRSDPERHPEPDPEQRLVWRRDAGLCRRRGRGQRKPDSRVADRLQL